MIRKHLIVCVAGVLIYCSGYTALKTLQPPMAFSYIGMGSPELIRVEKERLQESYLFSMGLLTYETIGIIMLGAGVWSWLGSKLKSSRRDAP